MARVRGSARVVLIGSCGKGAVAFVLMGKEGPSGRPLTGVQTSPREECWSPPPPLVMGSFLFLPSSFSFPQSRQRCAHCMLTF